MSADPSSPPPLLHVGYAKTGSTWLQQHLFADSSGVFRPLAVHPNIVRRVAIPDPFDYDRDEARAFVAGVRETVPAGLIPVVSWEHLVGVPHSRGFEGAVFRDRLVDLFPDGRYLIVIREQISVMSSRYEQFVWGDGDQSLREWMRATGRPHAGRFNPRFFEYDRLIRSYQDAVGPDRVLVLPWELFRDDAAGFVDRIAAFAGATDESRARLAHELPFDRRENAGRGRTATMLVRLGHWAVHRSAAPLKAMGRAPVDRTRVEAAARRVAPVLPAAVERSLEWNQLRRLRTFEPRFRRSNRRTEALTGIDLAGWGYAVER